MKCSPEEQMLLGRVSILASKIEEHHPSLANNLMRSAQIEIALRHNQWEEAHAMWLEFKYDMEQRLKELEP